MKDTNYKIVKGYAIPSDLFVYGFRTNKHERTNNDEEFNIQHIEQCRRTI